MRTKLLCLEDPYLRDMDAEIVEVIPDEGVFIGLFWTGPCFIPLAP